MVFGPSRDRGDGGDGGGARDIKIREDGGDSAR